MPARPKYGSLIGLSLPIDNFGGRSWTVQAQMEKAHAYVASADILRDRRVPAMRHARLAGLRNE
jgi:hypothetical protein